MKPLSFIPRRQGFVKENLMGSFMVVTSFSCKKWRFYDRKIVFLRIFCARFIRESLAALANSFPTAR
jgi:hypothetical protein